MKRTAIALLTAALTLQVGEAVHLVPAGEFTGVDGRPGKGLKWNITDAQGRALAARLNARHVAVKFQFDYEHQLLLAEKNGQPAPASGWAQRFEWRDGEGLFALGVQWTDRAREMLKAAEYRYLSPVLIYHKDTGQVLDVLNASLVGRPAVHELDPVAQERVAALNASFDSLHPPEPEPMNELLKALLGRLGLAETVSVADATAAVDALKAKAGKADELTTEVTALKAKTAKVDELTTEVAALKAGGAQPDPTKWVSLETFNKLNTEVAALKTQDVGRQVDDLIDQAKAEGKLVPAAEEVWRNVGKADIAQLKALIDKTPANPALAGKSQTNGAKPSGEQTGELDAAALAVCAATGLTPEQFKAGAAVA